MFTCDRAALLSALTPLSPATHAKRAPLVTITEGDTLTCCTAWEGTVITATALATCTQPDTYAVNYRAILDCMATFTEAVVHGCMTDGVLSLTCGATSMTFTCTSDILPHPICGVTLAHGTIPARAFAATLKPVATLCNRLGSGRPAYEVAYLRSEDDTITMMSTRDAFRILTKRVAGYTGGLLPMTRVWGQTVARCLTAFPKVGNLTLTRSEHSLVVASPSVTWQWSLWEDNYTLPFTQSFRPLRGVTLDIPIAQMQATVKIMRCAGNVTWTLALADDTMTFVAKTDADDTITHVLRFPSTGETYTALFNGVSFADGVKAVTGRICRIEFPLMDRQTCLIHQPDDPNGTAIMPCYPS